MRHTALVVAMSLTACAVAQPGAGAKRPAAPPWEAVEFVSVDATRRGGRVFDTQYSQKPNDAEVLKKEFHAGVVAYTCMVGYSYGSQWAGVGLNVNMEPGAQAIDARGFKTITIRLASQATRTLRIRLIGANEGTRMSGCYPVYVQAVTDRLADYTIPLSRFASEGWCGPQSQSVPSTLEGLVGFEIADTTIHNEPSKFSVGPILLTP